MKTETAFRERGRDEGKEGGISKFYKQKTGKGLTIFAKAVNGIFLQVASPKYNLN